MASPREREEAYFRLWLGGLSDPQIADIMGMSYTGVRRIRLRLGLKPNFSVPTPEEIQERVEKVRGLAESGMTDAEMSRRLGITVRQAARARGALGIVRHVIAPVERREQIKNEVRLLSESGWTDVEIAKKIGIKPTLVGQYRRRLGVRSRYRSPEEIEAFDREVRKLRLAGASYSEIAAKFRTTEILVHESVKRDNRARGIRGNRRWTAEEDRIVADTTRRIGDIASELGRTYGAVKTRRVHLARIRREQDRG